MPTSLPMSDEDRALCERYRQRLLREFDEITTMLEQSSANSAPVQLDQQSVGRLARMDAIQMQAMAQEAGRRYHTRKLRIERTLARMDEGEFGYCTDCGAPIGSGRLDVDPTFHQCIACASRR
jgi:DnaK suppressor protein